MHGTMSLKFTYLSCVTSQKIAYLIYTAAKTWNHARRRYTGLLWWVHRHVVGCCGHGNEPPVPKECEEFLNKLRNYTFLEMKFGAIPSSMCKGSQKNCTARAVPLTSTKNCEPYLLSLQGLMLKGILTLSIGILIQFLPAKSVLEIQASNLKVISRLQTKGREVSCYPNCLYTETHSDDIRRPLLAFGFTSSLISRKRLAENTMQTNSGRGTQRKKMNI